LFKTSNQRSESLSLLPPLLRRCHCHRRDWAAAKLLPPSCCHQAATVVAKLPATAELPLPPLRCRCCRRAAAALPKALLPPLKLRFRQAPASATKLAIATTLPLPPLPLPLPC
jgi:hypothetical protein